jgi:hypothetical protein
MPPATVWVAAWYLACGGWNVAFAQRDVAFGPWTMGVPFGVGQSLTAAILYWNWERSHE